MKKRMWIQLFIICILMLLALFFLVGPMEGPGTRTAGGKEIVYAPAFNYDEADGGPHIHRLDQPIFFPPFP